MTDFGNTDLLARIENIERESRILKRSFALVILAIGALFVMAQAPARPRVIEADTVKLDS